MPCQIIDGKGLARKIKEEIRRQTEEFIIQGRQPGLAVVLVGEDPASQIYVNYKAKDCEESGIKSQVIRMPDSTSEEELLEQVKELNGSNDIDGILVQLPLPSQIREERIIQAINPQKDVDGFHPLNMGQLFIGRPQMIPCTPYGCMRIIEDLHYDLTGKHAVVIGRSNIVGKPMASLLLKANATVTLCHSRTKNLAELAREADVLVAAIGKPNFINGEMIKPGALVLDVGINRLPSGKLAGDVEFETAVKTAGWLTPVPGGVGPMTRAMLLVNTLEAFKARGL